MIDFKLQTSAISLFESHIPNDQNKIKNIKLLQNSSTNISFLITNNKNQKFQVRLGNTKIDRHNESLILNCLKDYAGFIYYNPKNGNAIKTWFEGNNPSIKICRTPLFIQAFSKELKAIHKIPIDKQIFNRDYFVFEKISDFNGLKNQLKKYHEIILKYKKMPQVISHNDLRPANLVWSNKKVKFIDFEWATLNNEYWDLCNFLREIEYPINKLKSLLKKYFSNLDYEVVKEFLFACTFFAYQWTFFAEQTKEIITYRKNAKRLMTEYFQLIQKK
ncbi:phosphotransferase [Mycoplasmoides pirum]|uniref:phosphotransferase n=1 Tax=Mycoplasmoides pirum TaxID=2122 RepID=UPI000483D46D|nr:phosphotransferase [Mycoplasmoides pirum]